MKASKKIFKKRLIIIGHEEAKPKSRDGEQKYII